MGRDNVFVSPLLAIDVSCSGAIRKGKEAVVLVHNEGERRRGDDDKDDGDFGCRVVVPVGFGS